MLKEIEREDLVKGSWDVPRTEKGVLWCDASRIAAGFLLEIGGVVAEDSAWLRKKDDASRINVAKLDAVVSWVKSVVTNERRVKTKRAVEMVVERRLGMLGDLIQEFGFKLQLIFVPSKKNKANVRKTWLKVPERLAEGVVTANYLENPDSRELLDMHHMGADRTLFLARKVIPNINREEVRYRQMPINRPCSECALSRRDLG